MKKLILSSIAALSMSVTSALADYTFVVGQAPGAGTSVWAQIVAKELEKFLDGERITIRHIPGARALPGFNKWHNDLREDDTMVMVSNGSAALGYLTDSVDYDYKEYDSIGMMNLTIIAGRLIGAPESNIKIASASSRLPEMMAAMMLVCGPDADYVQCFQDNVSWINGMSQGEGRLAFKRGELNYIRENPAAYKKHIATNEDAEVWFTHGLLQEDGTYADDPNYPGKQFETLYEERWGVEPSGEFYDGYKLSKGFRDGIQKALWVNKGNPNRAKLVDALERMANDPESIAIIQQSVGNYDWVIGDAGNANRDTILSFTTENALRALLDFQIRALGYTDSKYKPELVQ